MAAYLNETEDAEETRRLVEEAIEGVIVVPPRSALGATLVFELGEGAEG